MDHRVKPGGDECGGVIARSDSDEAIQTGRAAWIASLSLAFQDGELV